MDQITVTFEYGKSIKDAFLYKEVPSGAMEILHAKSTPVIGDLHIRKWVLGNQPPVRLTITIATAGKDKR